LKEEEDDKEEEKEEGAYGFGSPVHWDELAGANEGSS
jgi:hypothetical protein